MEKKKKIGLCLAIGAVVLIGTLGTVIIAKKCEKCKNY